MNSKTLRMALVITGSLVAVAWFIEATTQGRGFISTYLAPLAFGPLLIAELMRMNERKRAKLEGEQAKPGERGNQSQ
jgi:hypothetical protein